MKTVGLEQTTFDACLDDAQHERVVITRKGKPLALVIGVAGMAAEELELANSQRFWSLIAERRSQKALGREELLRRISGES